MGVSLVKHFIDCAELGIKVLIFVVRLRSYGQRDPLQEYKKKTYKLFQTLYDRIEEETASSLVTLEVPDQPQVDTPTRAEPEEAQLNYQHPTAQSSYAQPEQANGGGNNGGGDDGMIYHGSRSSQASRQEAPKPETFKREEPKVGRNDPCPCGSGKKYKKCHGKPGAEAGASV